MNIRCRKMNCKFNHAGACHADNVAVGKSANCNTYQKDKQKLDVEFAAELAPTVPNNVPLRCQAQACLYNRECRCGANGIAVIDDESTNKADCATFIER